MRVKAAAGILGVPLTASVDEIREAFARVARETRTADDAGVFRARALAYEVMLRYAETGRGAARATRRTTTTTRR